MIMVTVRYRYSTSYSCNYVTIAVWMTLQCFYLSNKMVVADQFNTQIMDRVRERIEEFMNVPVQQIQRLIQYRKLRGFQYNMTAADHKSIIRDLYAECVAATQSGVPALLYFGLEDGTFYFIDGSLVMNEYREPGESGYNITEVSNDPLSKYYKYVNSCVNGTNGEPIQCILQEKDKYIECINDCEMIPCEIDDNERRLDLAHRMTDNDRRLDLAHGMTQNAITNTTIMCKNYAVKEIDKGSDFGLGYVPRTQSCVNVYGQPEQRPGHVLKHYYSGNTPDYDTDFGNCYFGDEKTIVDRSVFDNYAACPRNAKDGSREPCDTVYTGGYFSFNYDPRFRGWYIATKQYQKDIWTAPYPFAGTNNVIGITYSEPIYNLDFVSGDDTTLFEGVVAVDYDLKSISKFLIDHFAGTEMQILIADQEQPYYMIASSSRDTAVTKMVLEDDATMACPVNQTDGCVPARVTIRELEAMGNQDSSVLYRAFDAHKERKFPTNEQIYLKGSDIIGSQAYVSQVQHYTKSNNLHWYVFVVLPIERSRTDAAVPGDPIFTVICILGTMGFVGCSLLLVKFYSITIKSKGISKMINNTEEPDIAVQPYVQQEQDQQEQQEQSPTPQSQHQSAKQKQQAAEQNLTFSFLIGCTALNVSTFTLLGENTNATCMSRMWSFNLLFMCVLAPLFTKVWWLSKMVVPSTNPQQKFPKFDNQVALQYTMPPIVIQLVVLIALSFIDPPRPTEQLGVGDGVGFQSVTCSTSTDALYLFQISFDAILVFTGCVVAYMTKDLGPEFSEAKQIAFSMYNITFTGIVIYLIINLVELDQVSEIALQAVGILWGSFFCSFAFVLPLLLEGRKSHDQRMSDNSSERFSSTTGPDSRYKTRESRVSNARVSRRTQSVQPKSATSALDIVPEAAPSLSERGNAIETTERSNDNEVTSKLSFPFSTWETIIERSNDNCDALSIEPENN